jgi:hypothetical protein
MPIRPRLGKSKILANFSNFFNQNLHIMENFISFQSSKVLIMALLFYIRVSFGFGQNCTEPFTTTWVDGTTINAAATFTNQRIKIADNATVTFNANVTMKGCTFLIGVSGTLNINNSRFTLQNNGAIRSIIFGCSSMWSSINVGNNATITFASSDIRHGRNGLVFQGGSRPDLSQIDKCNFDVNLVCLTINDWSGGNSFSLGSMSGNTFTGYSTTVTPLPPMVLPFGGANMFSVRALSISGSDCTFNSPGTPNTITHMSTGAWVYGSTVELDNFIFIQNDAAEPGVTLGRGIAVNGDASSDYCVVYLQGNTIQNNPIGVDLGIKSYLTAESNTIQSNGSGIKSNRASVNLTANAFSSNGTAANVTKSNVYISNNTFTANSRAIWSKYSKLLRVSGNTFVNQTVRDVEVRQSFDAAYNVNITDNAMTVRPPCYGSIYVERASSNLPNISHTYISKNNLTIPTTNTGLAKKDRTIRFIEVTARKGAFDDAIIRDNTITCGYGNGPTATASAKTIDGIVVIGPADGTKVLHNTIDFTSTSTTAPNDSITGVGIGVIGVAGDRNEVKEQNTIMCTYYTGQ